VDGKCVVAVVADGGVAGVGDHGGFGDQRLRVELGGAGWFVVASG
jgi:hypothetical protein